MIVPKPLHIRLRQTSAAIFAPEWTSAPDDLGVFPTNGDRYVAEELWRADRMKNPMWASSILQALAASMHDVSEERLGKLGGLLAGMKVPVLVCVGTKDLMIASRCSEEVVKGLNKGGEGRARLREFEGAGHVLNWERTGVYNVMLEEYFEEAVREV